LLFAALVFLPISSSFASESATDDSHASNAAPVSRATVESVALESNGAEPRLVVKGHGELSCRVMRMVNPERIVLDFHGTRLEFAQKALPVQAGPVRGVRMSQFTPDVTRVVIDLNERAEFNLETHTGEVDVNFGKLPASPAPQPVTQPAAQPAAAPAVANAAVVSTETPAPSDSPSAVSAAAAQPAGTNSEVPAAAIAEANPAQNASGGTQAPEKKKKGKENAPFASQQPQPAGASKPPKGKQAGGIVPVNTRWQTYDLEGVPQYGYHLWDPYHQNRIKGDYPLEGKWFLEEDVFQNFVYKSRRNIDYSSNPDVAGVPFHAHNNFMDQNTIFGTEIRHNDDRFFPSDFRIHVDGTTDYKRDPTPFFSPTHSEAHAQVFDAFADIQIHNFGDVNFNQMFLRGGLQFFKSDFHGLIFNDVGLGGRLFGNSLSNRLRYDFAALKLFQKDVVSGFIDFSKPSQHFVMIAHMVYEDLFFQGWNSEWSFHWNHDPRRPSVADKVGGPNLNQDTYYIGTTFNGHIDRWIFNPALYGVFGTTDHNEGGLPVTHDVRAWTGVLDLEYPLDYWKFRFGYVYASGDGNPNDKTDTGFDSISDAVNLFGGPISFFVGENIKFGKNDYKRANSFFDDFRGFNNQANYVNPGLQLVNGGLDTTITPRVTLSLNANWIYYNKPGAFQDVKSPATVLHHNAGVEEVIFIRWKPFLHQINDLVILDTGFSVLQPLGAIKDTFGSSRPVYSFQIVPRLVF
jgi:hypothetical protein